MAAFAPVNMPRRSSGKTDVAVSCIALGCFAFGGDKPTGLHQGAAFAALHAGVWGSQDEEDTLATVKSALDRGVNFFDNAEMYGDGEAEKALGRALKASGHPRDSYVVATKVSESNLSRELILDHVRASIARIGCGYIDLLQLHWHPRAAVKCAAYPDRPLERETPLEETIAALEEAKRLGLIHHVGVCNFGVQDLRDVLAACAAVGAAPIVSNQVCYSLVWRHLEEEVVPFCEQHGISILPWGPLCQGVLTGKFGSVEDVPPGRQRSRLFSAARPFQRHGEAGFEQELESALAAIAGIADGDGAPMANTALAWAVGQPGITSVLMGARSVNQLTRNLDCLVQCPLSAATRAALESATVDLKNKLQRTGNLDPYEPAITSRMR